MSRLSGLLAVVLFLSATSQAQRQDPATYEMNYVGQLSFLNSSGLPRDNLVLSTTETGSPPILSLTPGTPPGFAGASVNAFAGQCYSATLDLDPRYRSTYPTNSQSFYPTGYLCYGKTAFGVHGIVFQGQVLEQSNATPDLGHLPQLGGSFWIIPTSTGTPAAAMDIACGFVKGAFFTTQHLIAAEADSAGNVVLVPYRLNNAATGGPASPPQPFPGASLSTGLPGPAIGLTVCPAHPTPGSPGENTVNLVVFVDAALNLHVVTYDIKTNTWGPLNGGATGGIYNAPAGGHSLSAIGGAGTTLAGLWVAQNPTATANGFISHDVAVSLTHPTNPSTMKGTVFILQDNETNPATPHGPTRSYLTQTALGAGGGPISHVPRANVPAPFFGGAWYIVEPGPWTVNMIVRNGTKVYSLTPLYTYPTGSVPSGPPLASKAQAYLKLDSPPFPANFGPLWIPRYDGGTTFTIDVRDGAVPFGGNIGSVAQSTAWAATPMVNGFTNEKLGYCLYFKEF